MKILIIQNVQAPSLLIQVQESPLCYCLMHLCWLILHLSLKKKNCNSVISTHNNIAFQNMFALIQVFLILQIPNTNTNTNTNNGHIIRHAADIAPMPQAM